LRGYDEAPRALTLIQNETPEERGQKLQRVGVEEHQEEEERVEARRPAVLKPVAAKEQVVVLPRHQQEREADEEDRQVANHQPEFLKRVRDAGGHDQ